MARYEEAANLLKVGKSPLAIGQEMGISIDTVKQYLYRAVGEGLLSRSQLAFSVGANTTSFIDVAMETEKLPSRLHLRLFLKKAKFSQDRIEEALIYFDGRKRLPADLFELLCQIERLLHSTIKSELMSVEGEDGWWQELPEKVRIECVTRKEKDPEPVDPYSYTYFIHLKEIFEKKWSVLKEMLPDEMANNRQRFLSDLMMLNGIRNNVMHPIRYYNPSRDDFSFLQRFHDRILSAVFDRLANRNRG
jgi:hypothetical protein